MCYTNNAKPTESGKKTPFIGVLYLFVFYIVNFVKNANSACKRQGVLVGSSWFGDSEFAFLVR